MNTHYSGQTFDKLTFKVKFFNKLLPILADHQYVRHIQIFFTPLS